jgi:hypothetical protein
VGGYRGAADALGSLSDGSADWCSLTYPYAVYASSQTSLWVYKPAEIQSFIRPNKVALHVVLDSTSNTQKALFIL